MNTTTRQSMSSQDVFNMLAANQIDAFERDLGCSGGGDWWGIQIPAPSNTFVLLTPTSGPFDANCADDSEDQFLVLLYAGGDYEDEADRPWTDCGMPDIPATVEEILSSLTNAFAVARDWVPNA